MYDVAHTCIMLHTLQDASPDFMRTCCSDDSFPLAAFSCGEVQKDSWLLALFRVRFSHVQKK